MATKTVMVPTTSSVRPPDLKPRLSWSVAGAGALYPEDTVMTHLSPDGGAMPASSPSLSRRASIRPSPAHPALPHPFSGHMLLTLQIQSRRARLAALETEMIAACEAAALGASSRTKVVSERERWSRATRHRYLAAAMRLEATYGPPMRRLRQEIGQLERLRTFLTAA